MQPGNYLNFEDSNCIPYIEACNQCTGSKIEDCFRIPPRYKFNDRSGVIDQCEEACAECPYKGGRYAFANMDTIPLEILPLQSLISEVCRGKL